MYGRNKIKNKFANKTLDQTNCKWWRWTQILWKQQYGTRKFSQMQQVITKLNILTHIITLNNQLTTQDYTKFENKMQQDETKISN
jgi:hypothetical protein